MSALRRTDPSKECSWCVLVFAANAYRAIAWCDTHTEASDVARDAAADLDDGEHVFVMQAHEQTGAS